MLHEGAPAVVSPIPLSGTPFNNFRQESAMQISEKQPMDRQVLTENILPRNAAQTKQRGSIYSMGFLSDALLFIKFFLNEGNVNRQGKTRIHNGTLAK